jgi:hypothetical protein
MTDLSSASLLSSSISAIPALTTQQFGKIPEIGLPDGRGISIQSALNTSTASSENLNDLKGGQLFNGTVSNQDKTDFYRFTVRDTKNWSFLLSGLTTDIKLAVVSEETGAVSSLTPQSDSSTKLLSGSLRPGRYYLTVSGDAPAASNYRLSLLEGNTYFVSGSGSDSNLGTYNAPYATIEAATKRLDPGDTVMIRGGTYYDRVLQLTRGGTSDRPITVQSVPGEAVIVDHGFKTESWTATDNPNIFRTNPIIAEPTIDRVENIVRVVVNNNPLTQVLRQSELKEGTFWVDGLNGTLYTWDAGGKNPTGQEVLVLARRDAGITSAGIRILDVDNVIIDGISTRAADVGILAERLNDNAPRSTGLTIRNSEVKFAWNYGIRLDNWNGAVIENNNVHNNAQLNFPRDPNGIWPHAIIGYDTSDVIVKGNRIHNNNGEGVGPYIGSDRWQILNNIIYDNWSVNVYVDTDLGDVVVDGNLIYNTGKYKTHEKDFSDGIRIANEIADLAKEDQTPGIYNIRVTNNVIAGTNGGIRSFAYEGGPSYLLNSVIANNTIGPLVPGSEAIYVDLGENVKVLNNLVTSNTIFLYRGINSGIVAQNNGVANANQVLRGRRNVVITDTKVGELNLTGLLAENYAPIAGTIWYGSGVAVPGGLGKDFAGKPRSATNPSIGAFEVAIVIPDAIPNPVPDPMPNPTPNPTPQPVPDPKPMPQPMPQPVPQPTPDPEPQREFQPTALAQSIASRLRYGR